MSITGQFAGGISRALTTTRQIGRDQAAVLAGLAAPLVLTAILIPFRDSFPNTNVDLTRLLGLSACRFQDGAAGIGSPPRLLRDGRVISSVRVWDPGREGLPLGVDTELLAEAGGLLQGRFLLTPGPEARPTLEQRLVAVGLADQAGAALAGARLAGLR